MNLILISDAFPPMRTSAAVHMHELAIELNRQGHEVIIISTSDGIQKKYQVEVNKSYRLVTVRSFRVKGVGYLQRFFAELFNPLLIIYRIIFSKVLPTNSNGIIWYSPSIFFSPLIYFLSYKFNCRSYLILRDLFPRWALDLGLIKYGFMYKFLRWFEVKQYKAADIIGVQSPGNKFFFSKYPNKIQDKVEVLWTWISTSHKSYSSIDISRTALKGRKIFLYTGNMGVAQDLSPIIRLAGQMKSRSDVGFLLVGRGEGMSALKDLASKLNLDNILFYPEIPSFEISALCSQCHLGIVSLDLRHKTHNIPGKFLTYMNSGLPVFAKVNPGNDLVDLISKKSVGVAITCSDEVILLQAAKDILRLIDTDTSMPERCRQLSHDYFSTEKAAKQIISGLQSKKM